MPTSIRLDARADSLLKRLAKQRRQTKSEVVRAAIHALAREADDSTAGRRPASAYDRFVHVVGIADSGGARLSDDTGERLRKLLSEKRRGRRSG